MVILGGRCRHRRPFLIAAHNPADIDCACSWERGESMRISPHLRRGRPMKFGRPSQVVALTLPVEVVCGRRKIHPDLGWAIVALFEKAPARRSAVAKPHPDAELVTIADRRSLIVVNREVVKSLPGI